jgi:hypothetical protein
MGLLVEVLQPPREQVVALTDVDYNSLRPRLRLPFCRTPPHFRCGRLDAMEKRTADTQGDLTTLRYIHCDLTSGF